MTENKRFILDDAGELIDLNTHKFVDYGEECCNLLNELAEENTTLKERRHEDINELAVIAIKYKAMQDENEQLRNRLKDWYQRTFKAHEYFDILEKIIDEVCDDDISNQIWKEYEKREKLIE